ncbi:MAG: hypothetical protein HQL72_06705 [Magnetococcales bacterium]|nr:hypothetical protein [Magnetococcales bacterium]
MQQLTTLLLSLIVVVGVSIAVLRFFLVPRWKKKKVLRATPYCPSLFLPKLSETLDLVVEVPSQKDDATIYRVNVYQQTCTCHRFQSHRSLFPYRDVRRLCRHLRKEFETSNALLGVNELLQCIIKKRVRDRCFEEIEIKQTLVGIGFHPKSDFIHVYSRVPAPSDSTEGPLTGPYEKFTLTLSQEIWIYGTHPPAADEIIATVSSMLKKYRVVYEAEHRKQRRILGRLNAYFPF